MTEGMVPPPAPPLVSLTEDEYYEQYVPISAPGGGDTWQYDEIKGQPTRYVWSEVETGDADHDAIYALPGWHVVNVIGYQLTTYPWPDENIEALVHEFEPDPDDEDEDDYYTD